MQNKQQLMQVNVDNFILSTLGVILFASSEICKNNIAGLLFPRDPYQNSGNLMRLFQGEQFNYFKNECILRFLGVNSNQIFPFQLLSLYTVVAHSHTVC